MSALLVASRVELSKLRRTLALAVAVAVPIALLAMLGANILSRDPDATYPAARRGMR